METIHVQLNDPHGLHLRPAAKIVDCAKQFESKITLCRECIYADSCSVLQLLTLRARKNDDITVIAEGADEKEAVRKIAELFSDGGGI